MLVFPSHMHPTALVSNNSEPFEFSCDMCEETGEGRKVTAKAEGRDDWAVLPEEWAEIEDRRPFAKKPFVTVCTASECIHRAKVNENGG